MAKPNYQYEKRQRDLAKKHKQEEKRRQKLAGKTADKDSTAAQPEAMPANNDIGPTAPTDGNTTREA